VFTLKDQQSTSLQKFKDGMIGHDLKNPLNAMLGYAEEIEAIKLKGRVRNTTKMMLNYVLNLLDVQKIESSTVPIKLSQIAFDGVFKSAYEQTESVAQEKGIKIELKV
jgi:signal transduction histidine kinase